MDYVFFISGLVLAGMGGEVFLRGILGLSRWARLTPAIIGTTVAAFATSAPELSVGISASVAGNGEVMLGDALGSNIVNVSLILGLVLVSTKTAFTRSDLEQNLPVALLAPVLTLLLSFDGSLGRVDGILLLLLFSCWVVGTFHGGQARNEEDSTLDVRRGSTLMFLSLGLFSLAVAGSLIVKGAVGIGRDFSLSEYLIGTTIVALGTSIPELATGLVSAIRGYHEVSLQTIMGSNIFNGLFIIGLSAVIAPISIDVRQIHIGLVFGLLSLLFMFPGEGMHLGARRGVMLLLLYSGYVALLGM